MAAIFLFFQVFGVLAFARPVYAFPAEITVDIPRAVEGAFDQITKGLVASALGGLMQAATYMFRKVAHDAAVYIASGNKGQGSLVYQDGVGKYLENTAKDAAADGIAELGQPFGLSLCGFPDVRLQIFLQVGLKELYGQGPPTPNCNWQQLDKGFSKEAFEEKYGPGFSKLVPEKFSDLVSVKNSDFGVAFGALGAIEGLSAGAREASALQRLIGQGYKDVTDLISGEVKTPAQLLRADLEQLTPKEQNELTAVQLSGIYSSQLLEVIPMAASVFVNTLASQLLNKLIHGLFDPSVGADIAGYFGVSSGKRSAAQNAFRELLVPTVTQVNSYDIVSEFFNCPPNPGLNNCVIDNGLQQAILRGTSDRPLTIKEAMDQGFLDPNRPLISPRRAKDNTNIEFCQTSAYCYSNIQKLRKARILPLGFEVAAFKADPDNPPTLRKIVDDFNRCAPGGQPSNQFPFCHLINPNWVIKAPAARCLARVHGPELVDPGTPNRRPECVDLATCVEQDSQGNCVNYGYCTKEKNTWRLGADVCEPQYATCERYVGGANRQAAFYLSRTIDFDQCDAGSVGCRAYSAEEVRNPQGQIVSGQWLASINADLAVKTLSLGRNQTIFLNQAIVGQTCSPGANGCTAFYPAQKDSAGSYTVTTTSAFGNRYLQNTNAQSLFYLKKAPDYLGCYDADPVTNQIDWPQTIAAATNLGTADSCSRFARACAPPEVGCDAFTVVNDPAGPSIPGIIGGSSCAQSCVGYDTFKQEQSTFEPAKFPVYLVPSLGKQCEAAFTGCSEFTNLDAARAGGENKEYFTYIKYCEKPAGNNEKTFYTWEGSAREGYTLKVHRLLQVTSTAQSYIIAANPTLESKTRPGVFANPAAIFALGAPAYADTRGTQLEKFYRGCNEDDYTWGRNNPDDLVNGASPDCRAFFDDNGNTYYRLMQQTVTVSEQCHQSRKTESFLEVDAVLTTPVDCQVQGGLWGPLPGSSVNQCQRCVGGGRYANGACVYNVITSESTQCPSVANGCREYIGNTGRTPRIVFDDRFEVVSTTAPDIAQALLQARANWQGQPTDDVRVVAESVRIGEQSLSIGSTADTIVRVIAPTLERATSLPGTGPQTNTRIVPVLAKNEAYELTFWARAAVVENLEIALVQNGQEVGVFTTSTGNRAAMSISNIWKEYRLGPTVFTGDPGENVFLRFTRRSAAGSRQEFYVDNVRLKSLDDHIFLIKNSWQTPVAYNGQQITAEAPLACDSNPTDPYPGEALGCRLLEDTKGIRRAATGFEQLCRADAVGCAPVYDTHNTLSGATPQRAQVYNLWCAGVENTDCHLTIGGEDTSICHILRGATGCFITTAFTVPATVTTLPTAAVVASTIVILADTPSTTPIYLTDRPEFACDSNQKGCQRLGLEKQILPQPTTAAFAHDEVYLLNDPDRYVSSGAQPGTLCRQESLGCAEFKAETQTVYFKDPQVSGQATCDYRPGLTINGATVSGWFVSGNTGECSQDNTQLCRADSDCGVGNACLNQGQVPCYRSFIRRNGAQGLVYDIHSNSDPQYAGFVGVCAESANQCTEFIDHADTSAVYPNGHPYYALANDKLKAKTSECDGQVSLTEGCVLFDQTDNPRKQYSADLSYRASESANQRLVSPVVSQIAAQNDSNIIIKVNRDRSCSEWLACKGSVEVKGADGKPEERCYDYRACRSTATGVQCADWVNRNELSVGPLTEDRYIGRGTGWYDPEYAGYTMFNKRQINDYAYLRFDVASYTSDPTIQTLGELSYAVYPVPNSNLECTPTQPNEDTNWRACGPGNGGRCYGQRCFLPTEGTVPIEIPDTSPNGGHIKLILDRFVAGNLCKAFPEDTSPFASVVAKDAPVTKKRLGGGMDPATGQPTTEARQEYQTRDDGFDQANICQNGDCACMYDKHVYRDVRTSDYWTFGATINVPTGICTGGENDGEPCKKDLDCQHDGSIGQCHLLIKKETHVGLTGYCLERDLSRPIDGVTDRGDPNGYACLTWLPIQVSASAIDIYNLFKSAGYDPDVDARIAGGAQFGEVYCSAGTKTGAGFQTRPVTPFSSYTLLDEGQAASLTSNSGVSSYFPSNTGIVTSQNCTDTGFQTLMCDTPNQSEQFMALQAWGWRNIGSNAFLMRLETTPTLSNWQNYFTAEQEKDNSGLPVNPDYFVFPHFAHFYGIGQQTGSTAVTFGTVMHPPRDWARRIAPFTRASDLYRYDDFGVPGKKIVPIHRSNDPEPPSGPYNFALRYSNFGSAPLATPLLVQRTESAYMKKSDMNRVYFVPLTFPGKAEGTQPYPLSTELYIDIADLDHENPAGPAANMRQISMVGVDSDTGDGSYFIDRDTGGDDYNVNGYVWSYKLQRTPGCQSSATGCGLIYFHNYDLQNATGQLLSQHLSDCANTTDAAAQDRCERNKIDSRYVMVMATNFDATQNRYENCRASRDLTEICFPSFLPTDNTNYLPNTTDPAFPTNAASDPFNPQVPCSDEALTENWLAIGMDFNSRGEFLGYISRWCGATEDESGLYPNGIQMATFATLNDQCQEFAQVYDAPNLLTSGSNKAWTDRVWQSGLDQHPASGLSLLTRTFKNQPFGSLKILSDVMGTQATLPDVTNTLSIYTFRYPELTGNIEGDGVPYACARDWLGAAPLSSQTIDRCNALYVQRPPEQQYSNASGLAGQLALFPGTGRNILADLFAKVYRFNDVTRASAQRTRNFPGLNVSAIEVGQNPQTLSFGPDYTTTEIDTLLATSTLDTSGPTAPAGTASPQIYSLNPVTCKPSALSDRNQTSNAGQTVRCSAAEANNMTVNDTFTGVRRDYDGDGVFENDTNGDGVADPLIGIGSVHVRLSFFAYADDNRMPIRQVMVRWLGGSVPEIANQNARGLYKNRKPFCSPDDTNTVNVGVCGTSPTALNGMTCVTHNDCPKDGSTYRCYGNTAQDGTGAQGWEWDSSPYQSALFGNASRACDDKRPFVFSYDYTCTEDDVRAGNSAVTRPWVRTVSELRNVNSDAYNRLIGQFGLQDADIVCVYRPRVQVKDNWGWCNGVEASGDQTTFREGENRFNAPRAQGWWDDNQGPLDRCSVDRLEPWTPYKGVIIVVPPGQGSP